MGCVGQSEKPRPALNNFTDDRARTKQEKHHGGDNAPPSQLGFGERRTVDGR
jgi:hypothetical protein